MVSTRLAIYPSRFCRFRSLTHPLQAEIRFVPYSSQLHNNLMDAHDAAARFDELRGRNVVDGALKDVFFRHGVADTFAVRLLHRHFDVAQDEKVVHCGNVAMPWVTTKLSPVAQDHIVPSSFIITSSGDLFPYEFTYAAEATGGAAAKGSQDPEVLLAGHAAFLRDFNTVLKETGLIDVLSLAVLAYMSGGKGMETTEGRANVTIPLDAANETTRDDSIETIWTYDTGAPLQAPGQCKVRCVGPSGKHKKVHKNTRSPEE